MLKIQRSLDDACVVFALSGRLEREGIGLLQQILELEPEGQKVALVLSEVRLVDRPGVAFLEQCERSGVALSDCPAYVREWIENMRHTQ